MNTVHPAWLTAWMKKQTIDLWNVADLKDFATPADPAGKPYPRAVSWAVPMNPQIMAGISNGPNQAYADEYQRVNQLINAQSRALAAETINHGYAAAALAASERTDTVGIKGDFPHKTAATRSGIGWIGRHCQLITRPFGPWVRLGTVFTDADLAVGTPINRGFCGDCTSCVEACPANALKGSPWHPGIRREELLDVRACDRWKKEHYFQFHKGHNCGICSAVCPFGLKALKRSAPD